MEWQSVATLFILGIAATIVVRRMLLFVGTGKTRHCGSCVGCDKSEKGFAIPQFVSLSTELAGSNPVTKNTDSADVGPEKTA